MKKIVGIMAVAAMATSMFAADVAAKVNILGDLANYSKDSGFKALGIAEGGQGWNPSFALSANGDNAGATMSFFDDGAAGNVSNVNYSIWFKPADMLKVTVGNYSNQLFQETIDWSNSATKVDANGYALSLDTNGFTADLFLNTTWSGNNFGWNRFSNTKAWLASKDGTTTIGETYVKVGYNADFGSIAAYADLFTTQEWKDWGAGGIDKTAKGSDFGLGYKGTFGPVTASENLIAAFDDAWKFGIIRSETFVTTNISGIGISAFVVAGYSTDVVTNIAQDKLCNQIGTNKAFVGATAKVTFAAGPFGGYVYLKDDNFITDNFSMTIKPGVTKNVGACAIDLAIDVTAAKDVKVDVPVVFTVAF